MTETNGAAMMRFMLPPTHLHTVVVQVDPGLLRLLLLEELVRLDPPLPGLLRLGTSKPHLEGSRRG